MNKPAIKYQLNTSSVKDIMDHFNHCDPAFINTLSSRVVLEDYAKKLHDRAVRFEAWNNNALVGMIAAYFNEETATAFITNVSVNHDMSGQGIASTLMRQCMAYATEKNFHCVKLEVEKNNVPAISLYHKFSFTAEKQVAENLSMICNITR